MNRVLVATDGSPGANRAVGYAAAEARSHGAELLIVNVIGRAGLLDNLFLRATEGQQVWLEEMLDSLSGEILTKARALALGSGDLTVRIESRSGKVTETILEIAKETGAEIIVAGKRGAGDVTAALLGSVSQKLVSLSPLPVTVVP